MDHRDPGFDVVQDRVARVFDFLTAVSSSKDGPPLTLESDWVLPLDTLPAHPAVHLRGSGRDDDALLSVDRVPESPCPSPPSQLDGWLVPGWNRVDGPCAPLEARNLMASDGESVVERFDDDADREVRFTVWQRQRTEWLTAERAGDTARALYQRLFQLRSMMEREPDRHRLVLVDGFLHSQSGNDVVDAPLLLLDVELVFEAERPRLVVNEGGSVPRLAESLLSSLLPQGGPVVQELQRNIDDNGDIHPLETSATAAFLAAAAARLWSDAVVVDARPATTPTKPTLYRRPTLALLKRTAGLPLVLSTFAKEVRKATSLPDPLARIVDPSLSVAPRPAAPAIDLLFTKPSNDAQDRIARLLAQHGAVVVQGPPGTGKTHTIANLVGHLLAHGKSILVTSHTTKALRVLRDQVVPELQPLCVAVLDSDQESKKQLESSIHGIVDRLGKDPKELEDTSARLEKKRRDLQAELQRLRDELTRGRRAEYDAIVVAGEAKAPSDAAREVAAAKGVDDWLPLPVQAGAPCPLTDAEVRELYRLNAELRPDDEVALQPGLPDPQTLMSPPQATALFALLSTPPLAPSPKLWSREPAAADLEAADKSLRRLLASRREEAWWRVAVDAGLRGDMGPWTLLRARIQDALEVARGSAHLWEHTVDLKGWSLSDAATACDEMLAYVDGGGSFSRLAMLFRSSDWKKFLSEVVVDGHAPDTAEALQLCRSTIRLQTARAGLLSTWEKVMTAAGGPPASSLGERCEQAAERHIPFLDTADAWRTELDLVKATLDATGLRWGQMRLMLPPRPGRSALDEMETLLADQVAPALGAGLRHVRWQRARAQHQAIDAQLQPWRRVPAVALLIEALNKRDVPLWTEAHGHLSSLLRKRAALTRRSQLLDKLIEKAPAWRDAIGRRLPRHRGPEPAGEPRRAWLVAQWHQELQARGSIDLDAIQQRIELVDAELRTVTRAFVEARTWARQIRRTTPAQQNALLGWSNTMRRYGKGTGKRAATLLREMRTNLELSRQAVPVWIMPLSRLQDSFTPGKTRFDVVIVDEASQADMTALVALGMADEAIIVGDHEQVSPLGVGEDVGRYDPLIDQHLKDVPNARLYDNRRSLYDAARECFKFAVLDEHFRCVKDIISFSNALCYEMRIQPLRDESAVRRMPAVVAHRVAAGAWDEDRRVNEPEARETAALLVAATEQPEYADATFGMISLLGDEQALLVDELLRRWLPGNEYARRRIVCGNAAHFQGDERDVMFLGLGRSSTGKPLMVQSKDEQKQRINVAASRARDQMWVVHSLNPDVDLKAEDFRLRLLRHAEDPGATARAAAKAARTDSEFERRVLHHLVAAGYTDIKPQYAVGAYRLDLVVTGAHGRAALECDGDRFHPPENLQRDLDRQRILERLGWRFVRVRGSEFFGDETKAMKRVIERLQRLNVTPGAVSTTSSTAPAELRDRIVARAQALLAERPQTSPPSPLPSSSSRLEDSASAPPISRPKARATPKTAPPVEISRVQLDLEEQLLLGGGLLPSWTTKGLRQRPAHGSAPPEMSKAPTSSLPPAPSAPAPEPVVAKAPPRVATKKSTSLRPKNGVALHAKLARLLSEVDAVSFEKPVCPTCTSEALLVVRERQPTGLFIECADRACGLDTPVPDDALARMAARIEVPCFECGGALKPARLSYGALLICGTCKRKNTWRGVNDRVRD